MKVVLLGAPRPVHLNRWKDDIAEAGQDLGWSVEHLPARGPHVDDVIRACKGADMLIWARTHGHVPTGDVRRMLCEVEAAGTATVGIHLDLYWGVDRRQQQIGVDPWWSCEYVFTADGGHQDKFRERGVNHFWLPPPIGRRWTEPGTPDRIRWGSVRAAFVGSMIPDIHGPHRQQLLNWASRRFGRGFRRFGGRNQVWGYDLNRLYATAYIVLGDSAPADFYWSDRVPCTLGRGGLLAYPNTPGLAEQGVTGAVALLYDRFDFDGLGARINALSDRQAQEMRSNALDLMRSRHLWQHRLQDVERTVFK